MLKENKEIDEGSKNQPGREALVAALKAVEALSSLVKLLILDKELTDINGKIEEITGTKTPSSPPLKDAISALSEVSTSRSKNGSTQYLLHRLTEDFEYEKAEGSTEYVTSKETQWVVEQGVAQLAQDRSESTLKGANPVISCWVPEASIVRIGGAQENTGTWGSLGENPHKNKYVILVKPGKYEIYSELKQ